jgi:predicted phosphodiesterase
MSKVASKERLAEVLGYAMVQGDEAATEHFGITQETLERYRRAVELGDLPDTKIVRQIMESYSPLELKALAKGARVTPGLPKAPIVNFDGDCITFAHMTDFHIGSIYYHPEWTEKAFEECRKEGVQFICMTGDLSEGMSNRPGHIYELTDIGYAAQKERIVQELSQWEGPAYAIDGNHDRWFVKAAGALIVKDVCDELPNYEYLGQDEGDISINGIVIRLWHGEDGNSYATSYRVQKVVESLTGGNKPHILLLGHTHKQIYMFERHIHCFSGGCLQAQSKWMRGKRIAAHPGFWIIKVWSVPGNVRKVQSTWYPFYA